MQLRDILKYRVAQLSSIMFFFLPNDALHAKTWHCSSAKKVCELYDKNLVVGDKVGFFTQRNELIAIGKVRKMRGNRRMVRLGKKFGPLRIASKTQRLENGTRGIKIFEGKSKFSGGMDFRVGNFAIGSSLVSQHIGANFDRRYHRYFSLMVRTEYFTGQGELASTDFFENEGARLLNVNGFSLIPHAVVETESLGDLSLRGEFGVGASFVTRSLDGVEEDQISELAYDTKLDSGFGVTATSTAAIEYALSNHFKLRTTFQYGMMHGATYSALGLGAQTSF